MQESIPFATTAIILATCLFTWRGFRNAAFAAEHTLHRRGVFADKQFYRVLTSGFLHVDLAHLCLNMVSFYFFAEYIEGFFGWRQLLALYFGSIIGGSLLSLCLHRDANHSASGASGGVCGVIVAHLFLLPAGTVTLFSSSLSIPASLFAALFLAGTVFALRSKKNNGGYDAVLGGVMAGVVLTAALHSGSIAENPMLFLAILVTALMLLVYRLNKRLSLPLPRFTAETPEPMYHRYGSSVQGTSKLSVDAVLDKISEQGLDSLTREERAYLDRMSEKYRNRATSRERESELSF